MESSDSDAIKLLVHTLRTGDGPARASAIAQLQKLERIPPEILVELVGVLQDLDPVVRLEAALIFRQASADAIPVLLEALESEDIERRRAAATTLGSLGPIAKSAVPALQKALNDHEIAVEAAEALNRISPRLTLVSQLDQFLSLVMPVVLVLAVLLVLVGLIYYVLNEAGQTVIDMAVGFCLIGGSFGAIMGGSRWGQKGALISAFVLGLGGAMVGAGIGYVAGSIFGPVVQSLQLKKNF